MQISLLIQARTLFHWGIVIMDYGLHVWDTDAATYFYKSDEATNSS